MREKMHALLWSVLGVLAVMLVVLSVTGCFGGRKFKDEDVVGTWVPDTFSKSVQDGEITYQMDWTDHFSATPCEVTFNEDGTGEFVIGGIVVPMEGWCWDDEIE